MEERDAEALSVSSDNSEIDARDTASGNNIKVTNPARIPVVIGENFIYLHMTVGNPPNEKEINIFKKRKNA